MLLASNNKASVILKGSAHQECPKAFGALCDAITAEAKATRVDALGVVGGTCPECDGVPLAGLAR